MFGLDVVREYWECWVQGCKKKARIQTGGKTHTQHTGWNEQHTQTNTSLLNICYFQKNRGRKYEKTGFSPFFVIISGVQLPWNCKRVISDTINTFSASSWSQALPQWNVINTSPAAHQPIKLTTTTIKGWTTTTIMFRLSSHAPNPQQIPWIRTVLSFARSVAALSFDQMKQNWFIWVINWKYRNTFS